MYGRESSVVPGFSDHYVTFSIGIGFGLGRLLPFVVRRSGIGRVKCTRVGGVFSGIEVKYCVWLGFGEETVGEEMPFSHRSERPQ